MIIDFRVRPPYKSFMHGILYEKQPEHPDPLSQIWSDIDKDPAVSAQEHSFKLFIEEMEASGISRAVIMGRKADEYGEVDNEDILELTRAHPQRFIPFAGLNPHEADMPDRIGELARQGFRGICLDGGWLRQPLYYDDPLMEPVYAGCEKHGLIVSLTSSFFVGPDMTYSDPDQILRVARNHPKMKIVVPHACWPHVTKALALSMLCPNVYLCPDLYVHIKGVPQADEFAHAANHILKYRIIYASSYPVHNLAQSLSGWKARPVTDEALRNTLCDNALRLLGEK